MKEKTLDFLPGEGEEKFVCKIRKRLVCDNCGSPAHYKHTFVLPNARVNPASSGFMKDDISWCSDYDAFSCGAPDCRTAIFPKGYEPCSTFAATARFAHMFLYWEEAEDGQIT